MKTPFITAAEAVDQEFDGRINTWVCNPEITNANDIQCVRATFKPGECHNFHTHPEFEEVIYVLDGEIEQWVDQQSKVLGKGDCAHIPMGMVHGTFNVSDEDATILAILSPGRCEGPPVVDVYDEEPWKSLRG